MKKKTKLVKGLRGIAKELKSNENFERAWLKVIAEEYLAVKKAWIAHSGTIIPQPHDEEDMAIFAATRVVERFKAIS